MGTIARLVHGPEGDLALIIKEGSLLISPLVQSPGVDPSVQLQGSSLPDSRNEVYHITHVPSGARVTVGSCEKTPCTTSFLSYRPPGVSETACTIWLFLVQALIPQLPTCRQSYTLGQQRDSLLTICAANMCHLLSSPLITCPPHELVFIPLSTLRSPDILSAGSRLRR
jgi:hypothetical protein